MLTGADGALLWVPETTVDLLRRAAATWPESAALVCGEERLTYAEYLARVESLAGALVGLGAMGRRVAIVLRNGIDIALALFAVQAAGATAASLNPDYTAHELSPILKQIDPVIIPLPSHRQQAGSS